jgi:hypothetical protein
MVSTMTLKNSAPEIIGSVIEKNFRTGPAPSSDATSYSSRGTFFSAARKITIVPLTPHSVMTTIDGLTQFGSTNHCGPWMPIVFSAWLIAPVFPLSNNRNIDAVATAGVIFGR